MASDDDGDDGDGKVFNQIRLTDFFRTKRKRGRPRKKANTAYDSLPEPELKQQKKKKKAKNEALVIATKVKEKEKVTRTNWSKGDNKKKMDKAIKDWLKKTGDRLDTTALFKGNDIYCNSLQ